MLFRDTIVFKIRNWWQHRGRVKSSSGRCKKLISLYYRWRVSNTRTTRGSVAAVIGRKIGMLGHCEPQKCGGINTKIVASILLCFDLSGG